MNITSKRRARWRRYWDRHSQAYDRQMAFMDQRLFRDTRGWTCGQARGEVLEVAVGYRTQPAALPGRRPPDRDRPQRGNARDRSPPGGRLGGFVDLRQGDAEALELPDESFDTVVCTFSLCASRTTAPHSRR